MTHEPDDARLFVEQVLSTGLMLVDVLSLLLEDLPDDAFPGEEPAEVLVEMLAGSSGALRPGGQRTVNRAVRLAPACPLVPRGATVAT